MELLFDMFTVLHKEFIANPLSWNGTFSTNMIRVMQKHVSAYFGSKEVNMLVSHERSALFGRRKLGTRVSDAALKATTGVLASVIAFNGTGGISGAVGGVMFKMVQELKYIHASNQIARKSIGQIGAIWLDAEEQMRANRAFTDGHSAFGLRKVMPFAATYAAVWELYNSHDGHMPEDLRIMGGNPRLIQPR